MSVAGRGCRTRLAGALALLCALIAAPPAGAATIQVSTTADVHGTLENCSLREAITAANIDANFGGCTGQGAYGNDLILVPAGVYRLTRAGDDDTNVNGDLDVNDAATIRPLRPLDRVVVDGNGIDRVFHTRSAGVSIERLTIRGGTAFTGAGVFNSLPASTLLLDRVTVAGNHATSIGGGIASDGSSLTIRSSTISGNRSNGSTGGVDGAGVGEVTVIGSTITNNVADDNNNGIGDGGGVTRFTGTMTLSNTIVADNVDRGNEAPDCSSSEVAIASGGSNLIGTLAGCTYTSGPGDRIGANSRLAALADNGGPNDTHALRPGSGAINRGSSCLALDQRGTPRALGGRCDIGAYQLVRCRGVIVNRVGTPGPDRLVGTSGRDGIVGLGGNDVLIGLGGNDALCGGPGNDRLLGGPGNDVLLGGPGRDRLLGGPGRDRLFGGPGADRLFGGRGNDRLFGGRGPDRLFGGPGRDLLNGGAGRDLCVGGPGRDRYRRCAVRR